MEIFDIFVIIFLISAIIGGFKRGFIKTAGHAIGLIIGVIGASYTLSSLTPIFEFLERQYLNIIVFIILFALISRLIIALFDALDSIRHVLSIIPFINTFNRIFGAALGLFVTIAILVSAVFYIHFNLNESIKSFLEPSISYQLIINFISYVL